MAFEMPARTPDDPSRHQPADVTRAAEFAARQSFGRLVALLVSKTADIAAAEDALSEAFLAALQSWPRTGTPLNPDAWLLTVAKNKLRDHFRQNQSITRLLDTLARTPSPGITMPDDTLHIPDERLQLLLLCAHPDIAPPDRTALMLQCVMGMTAAQIASLFLVPPAALAQRLVRAKSRIRDLGLSFALPTLQELDDRTISVLQAIYAAYTVAHDDPPDSADHFPADETIALARLIVSLLAADSPSLPEALGLLALMLYIESRRPARRRFDPASRQPVFVPLDEQNETRWLRSYIQDANQLLTTAASVHRLGRFQLEAAIQSAHAARCITGTTDWRTIVQLYDGLLALAPTTGAHVGRAAAIARLHGPSSALAALREIPQTAVASYQPYHATHAHLLALDRQPAAARAAYQLAIGLSTDPAVRTFLQRKHDQL